MTRLSRAAVLALATLAAAACGDAAGLIQAPDGLSAARGGEVQRMVAMMDACDPATFNAVLGPGACIRNGGVTFQQFIEHLERHGTIGSWRFSPTEMNARVGQTLLAVNRGGEVHTFTEVAAFAGGIVPDLNALTGETSVAPECQALTGADFIPPGGTVSEAIEDAGTEHFMCCIHPWMRTTVHAH